MARRRRYELTDEQFERIEDALPGVDGRGRPYEDHRKVVNGIFWVLRSGAPWRDLPERYGSWKTVYDRFRRWADDGTLQSIARKLQGELDAEGHIDWEQLGADSTTIRASRSAAGGPLGVKKGTEPAEKTAE
ncbi:transposase [Salinibacter ruber]|jgi:transposase|uniref:Transposase n=1 Tax=Salinibacter ruber TaxID=146919 RepID=A0A9X2VDZ4_9BACT|nr:transposase [Salinibacter ruber]MCS3857897.1 transposase [Salinibacter ruber]MCS3864724.1 transposase [Salinibacter ruber]MCS4159125.1 transposase [Salinibacter ruber]MCS4176554.1 transposase [Salinibacter ruber]